MRTTTDCVFRSFLVEHSNYSGWLELPAIKTSDLLPHKVITFSKAMRKNCSDFDSWVVFYEADKCFERLWNNPKQYISKLKRFQGVITPDFSIYRNMPLVMQMWNAYRSRALAAWMQDNDIQLIPNVRFGDERTYMFCFEGIEKKKTVAVGTYGCIQNHIDREYFRKGLAELIKPLTPNTIIVYGCAPEDIFSEWMHQGIHFIFFDCEHLSVRKQVLA